MEAEKPRHALGAILRGAGVGKTHNLTTVRTASVHSRASSRTASTMKLHADQPDEQSITAYGEGWIAVNGERYSHSLLLSSTGERADWSCIRFEDLTRAHFDQVLQVPAVPPEVVLFGSGNRLRFVRPDLLRSLIDLRVGMETMDSAAACRTFNILAGEGRRVVLALLLEA